MFRWCRAYHKAVRNRPDANRSGALHRKRQPKRPYDVYSIVIRQLESKQTFSKPEAKACNIKVKTALFIFRTGRVAMRRPPEARYKKHARGFGHQNVSMAIWGLSMWTLTTSPTLKASLCSGNRARASARTMVLSIPVFWSPAQLAKYLPSRTVIFTL